MLCEKVVIRLERRHLYKLHCVVTVGHAEHEVGDPLDTVVLRSEELVVSLLWRTASTVIVLLEHGGYSQQALERASLKRSQIRAVSLSPFWVDKHGIPSVVFLALFLFFNNGLHKSLSFFG